MKKTSQSLTEGNIYRHIIMFGVPILIGQIFQNLYNSVDAIVVGRFVGTTALAAVSACSDIALLLTGFFVGLSTGSGVLFSRYFGAKDDEHLHDSIHTAVTFSLILGIVMAVLGIILTPFLLNLVACPADVLEEADVYLRIYFIGILFTSLYNVGSGVLRAVGDSRSPFYYLVIASLTNVVLDLLFVIQFNMGVLGVAVATIISQLISVIFVFGKMIRTSDVYKLNLKELKIRRDILMEVIDLGIPSAIQSSLIAVSNLFVQRYINFFGSAAMAGIGAAKKIDRLVGMFCQTIGLTAATFVGQNFGARLFDRSRQGIRACMILGISCCVIAGIPLFVFPEFFLKIFTTDPSAIPHGVDMLRIIIPFYFLQTVYNVLSNAVRGFGRSKAVMVLSILGMIGCRQVWLAITMSINYNTANIFIGYPVGWFFAALFVYLYYRRFVRKTLPVLMNESAAV